MKKLLLLGLIALAGITGCQRTKTRTTPIPTAPLLSAVTTPSICTTVEVRVHDEECTAVPSAAAAAKEGGGVTSAEVASTPTTSTPTPVPTSPIVHAAAGPLPTTYVVQTGDNLYRISLRFDVPMHTIAAVNNIRNINYIWVGQALCIPTLDGRCPPLPVPGTYVVKMGDTLYSIARRYGTTVEALMSANGLTSYRIEVGQTLQIPGGEGQPCSAGQYRVRTGDTVYSIAKAHNTTVEAIVNANGLVNYRINVGQCLTIPGVPVPTATGTPSTPTPTVTGTPPTATPTTAPGTPAAPGEVEVYTSVEGGFSVEYPKGWSIEIREGSFTNSKGWIFEESGDTAGVTGVIVMFNPTGDLNVLLTDAIDSVKELVPGRFGGGATVDRDYNDDGTDDTPGDVTMDNEPAKLLLAKVKDANGTHTANLLTVVAMHNGKGYAYFATAPLSSWNQQSQQFMLLSNSVSFR